MRELVSSRIRCLTFCLKPPNYYSKGKFCICLKLYLVFESECSNSTLVLNFLEEGVEVWRR